MTSLFDFVDDDDEPTAPAVREVTHRELVLEQIKRDLNTINGDPIYHEPSLEFYQQRLAAFRDEYSRGT